MTDCPSASQVKRAGSNVRKLMRGDHSGDVGDLLQRMEKSIEVIEAWRRAHYKPLVTANNGLRSMARTVSVRAEVTQRLKRRQTIIDKLRREPTLDLSRMQDIGGCRAVVASLDDLARLRDRIEGNGRVISVSDYIATPRQSGYRAVHLVVRYQERAIEIQLRTFWMHAWALAAEDYSSALGKNLKRDGTHPVQLFLRTASDIINLSAQDLVVPPELRDEHERRRRQAEPYLAGGA